MNSDKTSSFGYYFPFLDGVRGFAVLSVVLFHALYFNPKYSFQHALLSLSQAGWLGVPIFFVLSGYLISFGIFTSPSPFDFHAYVVRRVAKIVPPFLLSLIIFSILWNYRHGDNHFFHCIIYNITTLSHFKDEWNYSYINPVYWSLFIEIHFYIGLPIIYFFLSKFFKKADWITCAIFFIVPLLVRILTPLPDPGKHEHWLYIYNLFPRALDYFASGILFAIIFKKFSNSTKLQLLAPILAVLGIVLLCCTYLFYAICQFYFSILEHPTLLFNEALRYGASIAVFLILFLTFIPKHKISSILSFGPLVYVGLISYEWFLFHQPIIWLFKDLTPQAQGSLMVYLLRTVIPIPLTFGLASFIYHFLSAPILAYSKKYLKTRSKLLKSGIT